MLRSNRKSISLITILSITFSFIFSITSYPQKQTTIDSLTSLLDKATDSLRVAILRQLSWEYRSIDTSMAVAYGKKALEIAEQLNLKYERADIYSRLGVYKRNQGNYSKAMDLYFKGLDIAQKNKYRKLEALLYNNIGDVYLRLGINDQSLQYVNKALNISIELKDNYNLSYIYHMLGLIYVNSSKLDSALIHFKKSLEYRKKLNLQTGIATSYINIGIVHFKKANYDSSFIYYRQSLEIYKRMDDIGGIASIYKCFGEYYNLKGNYNEALRNFKNSMTLMKGLGYPQIIRESAEGLRNTYSKLGNFEKALYYQELATKIKDSISNNIYIQKITRLTENYKFDIKNREQEIIRKQKEEILNERISYQRSLLKIFIIVFLLLVVLIGIIIFFYRDKNKAYKALNLKNNEIAELNKGLTFANSEIKAQKEEIETQRDVLQEQSDNLTQLNFTKDKLFSIIAHDLRSPFNSIIGFSEFIKENITNSNIEEIKEMNTQIHQVGISTLALLENLLNWAKSQIHQTNIKKENLSITSIINENFDIILPQAKSKKVNLVFKPINDFDVFVDHNMVNTILRNLISNSIKYSYPDREISVTANSKTTYAEISIKDNGIGMSNEIKNTLFSSNLNTSALGTANEKGTGLGLAICNEFIKKLDGKIWVESELGKGSTFTFILPLSS